MENATHHYHVWVLEIQATDGEQLRFDNVLRPPDVSEPGPQPTHLRRHQAGTGECAGMP